MSGPASYPDFPVLRLAQAEENGLDTLEKFSPRGMRKFGKAPARKSP